MTAIIYRRYSANWEDYLHHIENTKSHIDLLEQTIARIDNTNGNAALWVAAQIQSLPESPLL